MATEAVPAAAPSVDITAVAKAADTKPVKEKKPRVTSKSSRAPATHPPYLQMVKEALVSLKERSGSSQYAIAKYVEAKYQLPPTFRKTLSIQLRNLTKAGKFLKIKNSFKLSEEMKKPEKEAKKPAVKKAAAAAKGGLKKAKTVLKKATPKKSAKRALVATGGGSASAKPKKVAAPKLAAAASSGLKKRKADGVPKAVAAKKTSGDVKKRKLSSGITLAPAAKKLGSAIKKAPGGVKKAAGASSKALSAAVKKTSSAAVAKKTSVKKTASSSRPASARGRTVRARK